MMASVHSFPCCWPTVLRVETMHVLWSKSRVFVVYKEMKIARSAHVRKNQFTIAALSCNKTVTAFIHRVGGHPIDFMFLGILLVFQEDKRETLRSSQCEYLVVPSSCSDNFSLHGEEKVTDTTVCKLDLLVTLK